MHIKGPQAPDGGTPDNRDRGEPSGSAPPTPPGKRVRTGRFEKLRYYESLGTPNRSK
ncbi:hypothetical protein MSSD14B_24090 [Marinobacter salsuginis]|uniref:Uncharacterized protein n=1 Tax=Marinobacter salsuginis TaxID=418719 RepID=A0A5M3Q113_9GAMM|nr:hypothetical protein MSSD14B_24090 [Marinobacter salsuginis]